MKRKEKVFGAGRAIPLDRNAKARVMAYARAWSAQHRQDRQHKGPLTRAFLEVLEALLWGFHNTHTGRCFPSYESIAARSGCARSTVAEALRALERAGVLSWQHRITRIRERCTGPVRRERLALAGDPNQQRLRVPRSTSRSFRAFSLQVRKSDGNAGSRSSLPCPRRHSGP